VCLAGQCRAACPAGTRRCGDTCTDVAWDDLNCGACGHACEDGRVCDQGVCRTGCSKARCDGRCRDLDEDAAHCGACDAACDPGQVCVAGSCRQNCVSPL